MNERIQELARQAGFIVDETGTFHEFAEKTRLDCFAKLIIRECQFAIVSRTDLPKHERKLYNNVLKEHFGVEE